MGLGHGAFLRYTQDSIRAAKPQHRKSRSSVKNRQKSINTRNLEKAVRGAEEALSNSRAITAGSTLAGKRSPDKMIRKGARKVKRERRAEKKKKKGPNVSSAGTGQISYKSLKKGRGKPKHLNSLSLKAVAKK